MKIDYAYWTWYRVAGAVWLESPLTGSIYPLKTFLPPRKIKWAIHRA